jgi:transcriptional regulator with XRE-family HTH domain
VVIAPGVSDIGYRVRVARERLGWSREALAFHSGISWSAIAQVESGRRKNLRPGTLSALASALEVTVDYLARGGPAGAVMLDHSAFPYTADEEFGDTAGPFLAEGVERSEAVLALASREKIEFLRERLGRDARRVEFVESATWLTTPASALSAIKAFSKAKLEGGAAWIRMLGEPIWEGRSDSEIRQWTRYESLVNLVFAGWPMSIVCPYDMRSVPPEVARDVRLTHPHTIERGETAPSPDYRDPGDFVL